MTRTTSTERIAAYYDAGYESCLRDYVGTNTRIRMANEFLLTHLRRLRPTRVLEVGCGIGSTSYLICEECNWVEVVGVDLSEKRIETARRLFPHDRLQFHVSAMDAIAVDGTFGAIVMMDVYEHIPRARVHAFHDVLARMLAPGGSILLTTPSPLHQARLAATRPDALQIVDETIGVEDIAELARAIGGTITSFNYKAVWHSNDYVHSVIERTPTYERLTDTRTLWQKFLDKPGNLWTIFRSSRERARRERYVRRTLDAGPS